MRKKEEDPALRKAREKAGDILNLSQNELFDLMTGAERDESRVCNTLETFLVFSELSLLRFFHEMIIL